MLRIHSIETFGTHEGPGIRLVVFLQGCHLRCLYCHNPDTWDLYGGTLTETTAVIDLLERQRPYFADKGGLTVSGGEPLVQRKALIELFTEAKKRGFRTALDTNGSLLDEDSKKLLDVTDLVLLDVKHIDRLMHIKLTGIPNDTPRAFARYCFEHNKKMWIRYVLVPGLTDQVEALHAWGKELEMFNTIERVEILPYHTLGVYKYKQLGMKYKLTGYTAPSKEQIDQAYTIFSEYFPQVTVR